MQPLLAQPIMLSSPRIALFARVQTRVTTCALLLAFALASAGCTLTPAWRLDDAAEPAPAPSDAAGTPALDLWWSAWADPVMLRLIEQTLAANPSLQSARHALQQARAQRDLRLASLEPSLTLSGAVQRNTSDGASSLAFRTGADASWELDLFDVARNNAASSAAEVVAAQANLRDVQLSLSAEAALTYLQWRSAQAQIELLGRSLDSLGQTTQLTRWRAQAGLASALDVAQAEAAQAQTLAQQANLRASAATLRHSLDTLRGRGPGELMLPQFDPSAAQTRRAKNSEASDLASNPAQQAKQAAALDAALDSVLPDWQPPAAPAVPLGIDAERVGQRADVRAAQARVQAALATLDAAQAARWPSIKLGGSVGLTALTLSGLGAANAATQVLASLSVPVWDGGARAATVRVQSAALAQSRDALQKTALAALKEVQDALITLAQHRERLDALQKAEHATQAALAMTAQKHQAGVVDLASLLAAQRALTSARDARLTQQAEWAADHIRLLKAVGGRWQDEAPPLPPPPAQPAARVDDQPAALVAPPNGRALTAQAPGPKL